MIGLLPFKRYFDFSGRSGRAEYWQFMTLALVGGTVILLIDMARVRDYGTPYLAAAAIAALITPVMAVSFRRLHDRGISGWWLAAHWTTIIITLIVSYVQVNNPYAENASTILIARRILTFVDYGIFGFLMVHLVKPGDEIGNRFGLPYPYEAAPVAQQPRYPGMEGVTSTTPPKSTPATPDVDVLAQIERLAKLRADGALTDEEFAQQKSAYLARL